MTEYRRVGKCNPRSCGGFCCKIGTGGVFQGYRNGLQIVKDKQVPFRLMQGQIAVPFIEKKEFGVSFFSLNPCAFLKEGECTKHNNLPDVCKDFPHGPDAIFYKIAKKFGCTYDFVKIEKRKKSRKKRGKK